MQAVWEFFLIRLKYFGRQPEALFFTFVVPVLLSGALAVAYRPDESVQARALVLGDVQLLQRLHEEPEIDAAPVSSREEGQRQIERGQADVLVVGGAVPEVVIPRGRTESKLAELVVIDALERYAGRRAPTLTRSRTASAVGTRYIDFLIPGLLGYSLLTNALFNLGNVVVEMRMGRLLRRLRVTPMKRSAMLLGFLLGQLLQALVEIVFLLGAAYLLFDVRCSGNLLLFVAFTLASSACFGGLAVLVAARPRTMEAANGLGQLVLFPMLMLSGVFFSAERFPASLQPYLKLIPTRAALDGMRAVFIEGAGVVELAQPALIVFAWGAVSFAIGVRIFRWS